MVLEVNDRKAQPLTTTAEAALLVAACCLALVMVMGTSDYKSLRAHATVFMMRSCKVGVGQCSQDRRHAVNLESE